MSREFYQTAPVFPVPEDSTASILRTPITFDGVALDLSSASGDLLFYCRTRSGVAVVDGAAASWYTDGSDGTIEIQMTAAVVSSGPRDLYCEFEIQGYNGGELVSDPFIVRVTKRAKVSP